MKTQIKQEQLEQIVTALGTGSHSIGADTFITAVNDVLGAKTFDKKTKYNGAKISEIIRKNTETDPKKQRSAKFVKEILEETGLFEVVEPVKKLEAEPVKKLEEEPEADPVKAPEEAERKLAEKKDFDIQAGVALYDAAVGANATDLKAARDAFVKSFTDAVKGDENDENVKKQKANLEKYAGKVFDLTAKSYGGLPSNDSKNNGKDINSEEALKLSWKALIAYCVTLGIGFIFDKAFNLSGAEQAKTVRSYAEKIKEQNVKINGKNEISIG